MNDLNVPPFWETTISHLVGGNWLPSILNFPRNISLLIIPIDERIFFQRGGSTTNRVDPFWL